MTTFLKKELQNIKEASHSLENSKYFLYIVHYLNSVDDLADYYSKIARKLFKSSLDKRNNFVMFHVKHKYEIEFDSTLSKQDIIEILKRESQNNINISSN